MKNKHFGFTLIELLVVIVIIGILATISTATFKSYFGKARDAERQSAVQNMALMVKVDGADEWGNGKFIYAAADLESLFAANDFRLPKGTNNICYLVTMAGTGAGTVGDDNEFAIVTWGESTSTKTTGEAGILVDGTSEFVDALKGATLSVGAGAAGDGALGAVDFDCSALAFADVLTVVDTEITAIQTAKSITLTDTGLTIDAAGDVDVLAP